MMKEKKVNLRQMGMVALAAMLLLVLATGCAGLSKNQKAMLQGMENAMTLVDRNGDTIDGFYVIDQFEAVENTQLEAEHKENVKAWAIETQRILASGKKELLPPEPRKKVARLSPLGRIQLVNQFLEELDKGYILIADITESISRAKTAATRTNVKLASDTIWGPLYGLAQVYLTAAKGYSYQETPSLYRESLKTQKYIADKEAEKGPETVYNISADAQNANDIETKGGDGGAGGEGGQGGAGGESTIESTIAPVTEIENQGSQAGVESTIAPTNNLEATGTGYGGDLESTIAPTNNLEANGTGYGGDLDSTIAPTNNLEANGTGYGGDLDSTIAPTNNLEANGTGYGGNLDSTIDIQTGCPGGQNCAPDDLTD